MTTVMGVLKEFLPRISPLNLPEVSAGTAGNSSEISPGNPEDPEVSLSVLPKISLRFRSSEILLRVPSEILLKV